MNIELAFSSTVLQNKKIYHQIQQILVNCKQNIKIRDTYSDDEVLCILENKLRLLARIKNNPTIFSLKIWSSQDEIQDRQLLENTFNIIINCQQKYSKHYSAKNILVIRNIEEIKSLICLSIFDLQKKCKIQYLIRMSQQKYQKNLTIQQLQKIAIKYQLKTQVESIKYFIQCINFLKKRKLCLLTKCFNIWLIFSYQKSIQKANQIIIEQKYIVQKTNRLLLKKCFQKWKFIQNGRSN